MLNNNEKWASLVIQATLGKLAPGDELNGMALPT